MVNTFAVRDRHLEVGKVYEFFGEIEEAKDGLIFLKTRVLKPLENFHPKVYQETTADMYFLIAIDLYRNKLMECMINRPKIAVAQKAV